MKRFLAPALLSTALLLASHAAAPQDVFAWAESAPGYWVPPAAPEYSYASPPPAYYYAPPPPPPVPVYYGPGIYFHFGSHSR